MTLRRAWLGGALLGAACAPPFDLDRLCDRDDVTCGALDVPADRRDGSDGTLEIRYAVLHATGTPRDTGFTMFNGGPSNSTIAAFAPMMLGPVGRAVRAHHDVVLIDQRGIPLSSPDLACPELQDVYATVRGEDLDWPGREAARLEAVLACADRLAADGVDLSDFDSVSSARDVADVMAHLGYDTYDVWGVSYGTILAQHVIREAPGHVRAAILDSVAPLGVGILEESPRSASLAWQALSDDCDADPACGAAFPDTAGTLRALIADLEADPRTLYSPDPDGPGAYPWTLDGDTLATIAAGASLAGLPRYLPWYVAQLDEGHWTSIASQGVTDLVYDPASIDLWTYLFRCTEQADYDVADLPSDGTWPEMEHAFVPVLAAARDACAPLGLAPLPDAARAPVPFSGPALLFAGRYDPTTPPWMAGQLAAAWPGASVHEVPGTGHIASLTPCAFDLIGAFVDDPSTVPDDACLQDLGGFARTGGGCDLGAVGAASPGVLVGLAAVGLGRRRRAARAC